MLNTSYCIFLRNMILPQFLIYFKKIYENEIMYEEIKISGVLRKIVNKSEFILYGLYLLITEPLKYGSTLYK
ncbi:hypothetical protein HZS_6848 [Henneguya salminicola]|nr:hypothetical protein HZS_6848 [Henneguya salminicola]